MYVIKTKDLDVYYDSVCALKNINLKIKEKEFLGITGPNGGGKTTLLKVLLGLIKPTKGSISIKNKGLIGYVPQFKNFDKTFPINVLETILMGRLTKKAKIFKRFSKEDIKCAEDIMRRLGILELKNRQISQLSGGQIQKVLIARALITNPEMLVLDEPTASIDVNTRNEIYKLLKKLNKEKTILIVSHDMENIFPYLDRVVYINKTMRNKNLFDYEGGKNG